MNFSNLIEKAYALKIKEPGTGEVDVAPEKLEPGHITGLILFYIDFFLLIITGLFILYLIWGGYLYFTAYGNEEKAQKAKSTIVWAIVGFVVALLARVIIDLLWKIFTEAPPLS